MSVLYMCVLHVSLYLSMHHVRAVLAVSELVWCPASWYEQQQVGRVGYFKVVGLVTTTQHCVLVFIPANHQTGKEEKQNEKFN